ncbi:30S ribosomal protein S8 [Patescibacteria group bacterium]
MMTDPISDMLTRIRNAGMAKKKQVIIPSSKIKIKIADILKKEKYIKDYKLNKEKFTQIQIELKYKEDKTPYIGNLKRISRPGRRVYVNVEDIPIVLGNFGIAIITTSEGIMTNKEAKKKKIGGEVLFEIF